jgi:hypothetical protein
MNAMLPKFVDEVALSKPNCEFYIDKTCVHTVHKYDKETSKRSSEDEIYRVKLRQDGEDVGYLSIVNEYRCGEYMNVYGVGSFRIDKSRGRHDETTTKDLKVAIRNAKKFIVGRDYTEIAHLIKQTITNQTESIANSFRSRMEWNVDTSNLCVQYALLAHKAKEHGMDSVILPADPKVFIKDPRNFNKNIGVYIEAKALQDMIKAKQGYGLSIYSTGSCAMYDFSKDSVRRYKSIDELPDDVQTKLAMFKVIEENEPHSQFGCKFDQEMYYIVSGELQMQS